MSTKEDPIDRWTVGFSDRQKISAYAFCYPDRHHDIIWVVSPAYKGHMATKKCLICQKFIKETSEHGKNCKGLKQ